MYFWKCWRETRARFVIFVILFSLFVTLSAVVSSLTWRPHDGWSLIRGGADRVQEVWLKTLFGVLLWGAGFTALAGFDLGASGLSEKFEHGTTPFLLTRPRRRSYFIWTSWAVGLWELAGVVFFGVAAAFGVLLALTGRVYTWRFLLVAVFLFVAGAVIYSLTYSLAVLLRNGRNAVVYSLLMVFGETALATLAHHRWGVNIPCLLDLLEHYQWVAYGYGHFPAATLLYWAIVALVFPCLAQVIFNRAEV